LSFSNSPSGFQYQYLRSKNPEAPVLGFTSPSQVLWHKDRLYLLDGQLCKIHIFAADGTYLGAILGEGDGPGEVRNPGALLLRRDGNLAVRHGYPTKLEFITPDGDPVGRWWLQAQGWASRLRETPQGWFAVYGESKNSGEAGLFLTEVHVALHDDDGQRIHEFFVTSRKQRHSRSGALDEAEEYLPWYSSLALDDGQVVYPGDRDS